MLDEKRYNDKDNEESREENIVKTLIPQANALN